MRLPGVARASGPHKAWRYRGSRRPGSVRHDRLEAKPTRSRGYGSGSALEGALLEKIFLARIRNVLNQSQWNWEPVSDRNWTMPVEGDDGQMAFTGQVAALPEDQVLVVLAIYPRPVPPERRDEVARFLIGLNYQQAVGAFEMDFADGEVRYRVGFPIGNGPFDVDIFHRLLDACFSGLGSQLSALDAWVGVEPEPESEPSPSPSLTWTDRPPKTRNAPAPC